MNTPRIFISYSRADGTAAARSIGARLTRDHGFSVWRDLADVEGGQDWWQQVTDAIDQVEYVVLIATSAALASPVVRDEWRYARRHGVCVIPLTFGIGPTVAELPDWMRHTHIVDADEPEQWTRLIRTLEGPCRALRVPLMAEPPPPDFVPRPEEFSAVRTLLLEHGGGGAIAITAALKGAGGYGKTTLARALAHDPFVQEKYSDGVLWVTLGEQPGDAAAMLEDLIVTLAGEPSGLTSADARRRRLDEMLHDRAVLIVIDDVWNKAHLQPFTTGGDRCARLITTRDAATLPTETLEVRVDAMRSSEAIMLLAQGVGETEGDLAPLAARLSEWPLLLKLVNGILRDRVQRSGDSRSRAIGYVNRLLDRRGYKAFDARDPVQRHDAVAATLGASTTRLTDEEQARLRELVIFPEDVDVPLDTVALLWHRTGGLDEVDTETCLQTFFTLSLLLDFNLGTRRIRIHDVIRHYLTDEIDGGELTRIHGELVAAYRERCAGAWATGVDDGYFFRFLPLHLWASGDQSTLRELLLDPGWIEARLRHTDIGEILQDFDTYAMDRATHLMADAVRLSAGAIARDSDTVLPQLLGRIDDADAPEFRSLLPAWRARQRGAAWLCPQSATLTRPGGALIETFRWHSSAHRDPAAAFLMLEGRATDRVSAPGHPARRLLVTGTGSGVKLVDETSGTTVWSAECADDYPVLASWVTPDGAYVAASAGYWGGTGSGTPSNGADAVYVWQVDTNREALVVRNSGILQFRVSRDGRRLALAFKGGAVELWSIERGARLARWECGDVGDLQLGRHPDQVVVASRHGEVAIWKCGEDQPTPLLTEREEAATAVAVAPDGKVLVIACPNGRLEMRRLVGSQTRRVTLRGERDFGEGIAALFVTADGTKAISRAGGVVRVWNLVTAESAAESPPEPSPAIVATTPDGEVTVVDCGNGSVAVRSGSQQTTIVLHDHASATHLSVDGRWLLHQFPDGTWSIWNASTGERIRTLPWHGVRPVITCEPRVVYAVRGDRDAVYAAALTHDSATGSEARLVLSTPLIHDLKIAPDGKRVVILAENGVITWDVHDETPQVVDIDMDLSRGWWTIRTDGQSLIVWGWGQTRAFDLSTGTKTFGVDQSVVDAALTPNGRRALLCHDEIVTLWNLDTGSQECSFHADAPVHTVACPSDTVFLACSDDGRVHRLDLRD